jgi:hypothetical protein
MLFSTVDSTFTIYDWDFFRMRSATDRRADPIGTNTFEFEDVLNVK